LSCRNNLHCTWFYTNSPENGECITRDITSISRPVCSTQGNTTGLCNAGGKEHFCLMNNGLCKDRPLPFGFSY
jgi:hypothetical protein